MRRHQHLIAWTLGVAVCVLVGGWASAQQSGPNPGPVTEVPRDNNGTASGQGSVFNQTTVTTQSRGQVSGTGQSSDGSGDMAPDGGTVSSMVGDTGAQGESKSHGTRVLGAGRSTGASVTTATGNGKNEPILDRQVPPGPMPTTDGEVISMTSFDDGGAMPALTFLDELSRSTRWNILTSPDVEKVTLRFWVTNMTPKQALAVLEFSGLHYEFDEATQFLLVRTQEEVKRAMFGEVKQENFVLEHADLVDMEAIVTNFISPDGRVIAEPRTGQLMVWDTVDNLKEIASIVKRLDVPVAPRTFQLMYINAEDVQDSLVELLSERGVAHADPRTNTITVADLPDRLDRIEHFLATVDVELETRTWTLNYLDPGEIESRLETLVPEAMGPIVVDEDVRQVTITALPKRLEEVGALIERWDVKRKQVEIEAYLVSIGSNVMRDFGINWFYTGDDGEGGFTLSSGDQPVDWARSTAGQLLQVGTIPYLNPLTNKPPFSNTPYVVEDIDGNPIPVPGREGLSAVLEYLDDEGKASILSRPRVVVLDGEEATFENTEDRPYQEGGYSNYNNNNNNNGGIGGGYNNVIPLRVQFITVGTILKVSPTIGDDGNIVMDISAEESTADTVTVTTGDQSSTIPQKRQSRTETRVMVHDQQTLVIGGLRSTTLEDDVTRVPVLGDIPLLGRLFKTTGKDHRERELLAFLTPTIVDEYTMPEADRLADWEQDISKQVRESLKPLLERWETSLTKGKNEIHLAIGQDGSLSTEGATVSREEFEELLGGLKKPRGVTCVIRRHPNSDIAVYEDVKALVEQYGLKAEDGLDATPFVPVKRPGAMEDAPVEQEAVPAPGVLRNGVSGRQTP